MIGKVREFCEARDWDQFHSPKELAIGLITVTGAVPSITAKSEP